MSDGPNDILQFQAGREAAIDGNNRDGRRQRDWLTGYDQVKDAACLTLN